ncbi:MAG: hypothetical protein KGJ11_04800, partial [Candidatus Omnitrophica bacterium]|nr:hypothetical protein [Candidatus Omnitrophota bacterium]
MKTPLISFITFLAFLITMVTGPYPAACFAEGDFRLPAPGVMVALSPPEDPPLLKGIKVHAEDPFRFDFILDKGDSELSADELKDESSRLIKYFLASLTIPEKDLWVNLSPYEKDRIIPNSFGLTQMGRDLLAEDYILKQITASLIYPEGEVGKRFWKKVYALAEKKYGTTNIPVNTFNKVWIVPEKAVVYENAKAGTAYVVASSLKVMLEEDYLSLAKHEGIQSAPQNTNHLGSEVVREIVLPELTREVNQDKNFARVRQVYNSLILATWYKEKIKSSILTQVYADKAKVAGISIRDPQEKQKIYQRYLQAFKKGVYNYIKEEQDPLTQQMIPRKYFSGGIGFSNYNLDRAMTYVKDASSIKVSKSLFIVDEFSRPVDRAMRGPTNEFSSKVPQRFLDFLSSNKLQNTVQVKDMLEIFLNGLLNSDPAARLSASEAISDLIAAGLLSKEEVQEKNIAGMLLDVLSTTSEENISESYMGLLNALVANGFISRDEIVQKMKAKATLTVLLKGISSTTKIVAHRVYAQTLSRLIASGFTDRQEIRGKINEPRFIQDISAGLVMKLPVRSASADVLNTLVASGIIGKEEIVKQLQDHHVAGILFQTLESKSYQPLFKDTAEALVSLTASGMINGKRIIGRIREKNLLNNLLESLKNISVYSEKRTIIEVLGVLGRGGLLNKEQIREKTVDVLLRLLSGGPHVEVRSAAADALTNFINAGVIGKEEAEKENLLDTLLYYFATESEGNVYKSIIKALNALIGAGLVSRDELKEQLQEKKVIEMVFQSFKSLLPVYIKKANVDILNELIKSRLIDKQQLMKNK